MLNQVTHSKPMGYCNKWPPPHPLIFFHKLGPNSKRLYNWDLSYVKVTYQLDCTPWCIPFNDHLYYHKSIIISLTFSTFINTFSTIVKFSSKCVNRVIHKSIFWNKFRALHDVYSLHVCILAYLVWTAFCYTNVFTHTSIPSHMYVPAHISVCISTAHKLELIWGKHRKLRYGGRSYTRMYFVRVAGDVSAIWHRLSWNRPI